MAALIALQTAAEGLLALSPYAMADGLYLTHVEHMRVFPLPHRAHNRAAVTAFTPYTLSGCRH
jgi:hypothetical protein